MDLGESFQPFAALREQFGFIPNLFRAQSLLPGVLEAEVRLLDSVLFRHGSLSRIQKECILLVVAVVGRSPACVALHSQTLRLLGVPEARLDEIVRNPLSAKLSPANAALVSFALKLASGLSAISLEDIANLSEQGLRNEAILEAIVATALGKFLCVISTALSVAADFAVKDLPAFELSVVEKTERSQDSEPLLPAPHFSEDFVAFASLQQQFGFIPGVFRAQTLKVDLIEAEAELIKAILLPEVHLSRAFKDRILGGDEPAVLRPADTDVLRNRQFTGEQILEAALTTALAQFLATLQLGLGTAPDLRLPQFFALDQNKAHLSVPDFRPTPVALSTDPDADCVASVRGGDLDAFEELMSRHSQRVYRTLIGLLGDAEEARDAMQDTFLKAFQHLRNFEGRSKFSTWLLSIATNTAIQRLRDRKPFESLDEPEFETEEGFRPRQVQAWTNTPEQLYSQTEMRSLIESSIMKLPAKYRVVLMLRDVQQLSVEDSAGALNLGVPALKARLLRGRLMLREALAPHFAVRSSGSAKGVTI